MRNEKTVASTVLESYRLKDAAGPAVECMKNMEFLCRKIRQSLKKRKDGDSGMPEAERLIVEAHRLVWEEVQDRWKVTGEIEAVSIQPTAAAAATETFYW